MNIKIKIGLRIKKLRESIEISQEQLAFKSDLDRTYINSVENGKRNISIINIEKISKALGVNLKEFFNHELFK